MMKPGLQDVPTKLIRAIQFASKHKLLPPKGSSSLGDLEIYLREAGQINTRSLPHLTKKVKKAVILTLHFVDITVLDISVEIKDGLIVINWGSTKPSNYENSALCELLQSYGGRSDGS